MRHFLSREQCQFHPADRRAQSVTAVARFSVPPPTSLIVQPVCLVSPTSGPNSRPPERGLSGPTLHLPPFQGGIHGRQRPSSTGRVIPRKDPFHRRIGPSRLPRERNYPGARADAWQETTTERPDTHYVPVSRQFRAAGRQFFERLALPGSQSSPVICSCRPNSVVTTGGALGPDSSFGPTAAVSAIRLEWQEPSFPGGMSR